MTLRKTLHLTFCLAFAVGLSTTARAESWFSNWWPTQEDKRSETWQPYLEHPTQPQNTQWANRVWTPADWTGQRRDGAPQVIQDFYRAGLLNRQYVDNEVPVLEVGPNFYRLGGYDKRRVLAVVDDYYKITSSHENAMFTLTDWKTKKPIGLYTAHGLQLQ